MALLTTDHVIGDDTDHSNRFALGFSTGCVPRDFEKNPVGCYGGVLALDMPLIPREEWYERIKELEAAKNRISDLRRRANNGSAIPSLDQNQKGYCWAHSTTMCAILLRAKMGLPYRRLSAYFVACLVKNYQDQGGWAALSADFIAKNGVPDVEHWPEKSMNRANDSEATRDNAKLHVATAEFADMAAAQYDRNLSEDQAITLLLTGIPYAGDFNWWGHSVCIMDPVLLTENPTLDLKSLDFGNPRDLAQFGKVIGKRGINSWTDNWGDQGEFVLKDAKAHCDGGVALKSLLASDA